LHNILQHLTAVLNDNYDYSYNYDIDNVNGADDDNVSVLVWHVGLCLP